MIDAQGNNLVFLLCTPRSGSSLATVMLQNHSRLFAAQEMWFLMSLLDLKAAQRRAYGGGAILERFFNGVLPEDTFVDACRSFALQAYNGLLRGGAGADMVIDKSPRYYYLLEFLDALFPRSRRIWLTRNPLAVLASYKKLGASRGGSSDLEELLGGSAFDIKAADLTIGLLRYCEYFAKEDPYAYRLRYEALVADPRGQLDSVCRFLGTAYEEGMERYGERMDSAKSGLYFSMGVGDPNVTDHAAPHQQSVHAWKDVLSKREIELYVRLLGAGTFEAHGYGDELETAERMTGVRFDRESDERLTALRERQLAEATGCRWEPGYAMRSGASAEATSGLVGGKVAALEGEGDVVGEKVASLEGRGGVIEGKVAALEGRGAALEGASGAIEGQYGEAGMQNSLDLSSSGQSPELTNTQMDGAPASAGEPTDPQVQQLRMTVRALEMRLDASIREQRYLRAKLGAMKRKADWLKSAIPFGKRLSRFASAYMAGGGKK